MICQACVEEDEETVLHEAREDPRPPPTHWKTMLDDAIKQEESRRQASLLPGCSQCCGFGIHGV